MLPRLRSIFRIWKGWVICINGVTSRIGRISTCEPGRNATAPWMSTVKPPLTRRRRFNAFNAFLFGACFFKLHPCFFAQCFFAAEHGFAMAVFDFFEIDFNFVADLEFGRNAVNREFA